MSDWWKDLIPLLPLIYIPLHFWMRSGKCRTRMRMAQWEAKHWLAKLDPNARSAVAPDRFRTNEDAMEFVERLYNAGAVEVRVSGFTHHDGERKAAGAVFVTLPQDPALRTRLHDIHFQEMSTATCDEFRPTCGAPDEKELRFWWGDED